MKVDDTGIFHILWYETGVDWQVYYRSFNINTQSLSTTQLVSQGLSDISFEGKLEVDSKNNVHVMWMDSTNYTNSGNDYDRFYRRYNAIGNSWSTIEIVTTESTDHILAFDLAIDYNDNLYLLYVDSTQNLAGTNRDAFLQIRHSNLQLWSTPILV